jgi:hypothetical protein
MVVLVHVFALIAALSLANGGGAKQGPVAGPVAYDVFLPSGG